MTSPAAIRAKARGYLRQADSCPEPILADDLRELARKLGAEADRLERDRPRPVPPTA